MMEAMNAAVLQVSKSIQSEEDESGDFQKESVIEHRSKGNDVPVPTGLSALLSAVTLQLNDRNEEDSGVNVPKSSSTARVISSDADSVQNPVAHANDAATEKSTPTMVPEIAKQMPLPESLMTLLMDENNADILTFLPDGKFFAMRTEEFSARLMKQYTSVDTFESFLRELREAGFTHIETDQPGIEVFRHRLFHKGDWKGCELLIGELEERKQESSSPSAKVPTSESLNDHCVNRADSFKRRLSPAHAQRVNGESQSLSQKARVRNDSSDRVSSEAGDINGPPDPVRLLRKASGEGYRSAARTITAEKIILHGQGHPSTAQQPEQLEQQAVQGATRTIVTDAIESLLRDEDHTRETFHKHERALSQSSLPGLVPISKQLFASKQARSFDKKGGAKGGSPATGQDKQEGC